MKRLLSSLSIAVLASCGGDPTDPPAPTAELTVVRGAGSSATFATTEALAAGGPVEAIGVSGEGRVLAFFGDQLHELSGGALVARTLYAGEGDPTSMGAVHRIAPRAVDGAWIGAEAGLFALDELYTYKVPLLADAGAVNDVIEVAAGPLEGLWLATESGLHRRLSERGLEYEIEGLSGAATGVAIAQNGELGVAVIAGAIATLEPDGDRILVDRPPLDTGTVHAIAAVSDAVYLGAEKGVFAFRAGATPAWTQYTLADGEPIEVLALSIDLPKDAVWARTTGSLVLIEGESITSFPMEPAESTTLLAVDAFGDVWTASGEELARRTRSESTESATFTTDLLPWIQMHCSQCHMNQTQNFEDYQVFVEVAESALLRVRSGDMPRCEGGLRCPSDQRLPEDDYAVLEQWIRDGMPE